jgi:signal transduction histidine kinase
MAAMSAQVEKIILILDDEPDIPELVKALFRDEVRVVHFHSAAEFIAYVSGEQFREEDSMALIDIALGRDREAGFTAANHLSESEIHVPIIFISESSLMSHITRSAEAGSHAYLNKERLRQYPEDLKAAIAQAEGARLRQERERVDKLNQWGNRAVVLAGALSHEIKTLIAPMLNEVLVLRNRASEAPQLDRDVILIAATNIIRYLERAQSVINTAVNFISGKSDVLVRTNIDIVKVVADIVARHAEEHPPVRFVSCNPLMVHADATRVAQMVFNLINNAQKYAGDGHSIVVSVTVDDRFVDVCVRDYGSTKLSATDRSRICGR